MGMNSFMPFGESGYIDDPCLLLPDDEVSLNAKPQRRLTVKNFIV
jgi:hypothetical protein